MKTSIATCTSLVGESLHNNNSLASLPMFTQSYADLSVCSNGARETPSKCNISNL